MSQYRFGKVRAEDGSANVDALWEMIVGAGNRFVVGARCQFAPSGAFAEIAEHDIGTSHLTVWLDPAGSSPDIAASDSIDGPTTRSVFSGTASGGTGTTVTVAGSPWVAGEFDGDWAATTVAGVTTYRKITATAAGQLTVAPSWTIPTSGDTLTVHIGQILPDIAFKRGTPQDWVASPVAVGETFYADGNPLPFTVTTPITARRLILLEGGGYSDARLAGGEHLFSPYTVHRSFTANRNYPYPEPGDTQTTSILKRLAELLDIDIDGLLTSPFSFEAFSTLSLAAGWGVPAGFQAVRYWKFSDYVVMQGNIEPTATKVTGDLIGVIASGYEPLVSAIAIDSKSHEIHFNTNRNVNYEGPGISSGILSMATSWRRT